VPHGPTPPLSSDGYADGEAEGFADAEALGDTDGEGEFDGLDAGSEASD